MQYTHDINTVSIQLVSPTSGEDALLSAERMVLSERFPFN